MRCWFHASKEVQCPWVRRLGGPQNWSGKCGETPIPCCAIKQTTVSHSSP